MEKWIEATGRTEDAAVQNALAQLGLDRDSVSVEILERARSGFFSASAAPRQKVKVTYEVPDEAPAPQQEETLSAPQKEKAPQRGAQANGDPGPGLPRGGEGPRCRPNRGSSPQETPAEGKAVDYEARIRAFPHRPSGADGGGSHHHRGPRTENGIPVTLDGPKLGAVIGHRGETLDAIQQLTNYTVNRGRTHRVASTSMQKTTGPSGRSPFAAWPSKVAAKVVKYRRNITLEPMNAYERHVIHETLQDYPDVITYSTGTEPNRRTVVAYSRGKHALLSQKRRGRKPLHRRFFGGKRTLRVPSVKEGMDMTFRDRIHPQLRDWYDASAGFDFDHLETFVPKCNEAELANLKEDPQVVTYDRTIPGPAGSPDVKIGSMPPGPGEHALPCLFFYHGGGFLFGTVYRQEAPVPALCEARGVRGGLGGVPSGPQWKMPAPLEDCYAALLWAHENHEELGIDPQPGGGRPVCRGQPGRGGGPHGPGPERPCPLPADAPVRRAGLPPGDPLRPRDHRPQGLVPGQLREVLGKGPQPRPPAHPVRIPRPGQRSGGAAPLFSYIGQLDPGRDENIAYWTRMMEAGVPVEYHVFPGVLPLL